MPHHFMPDADIPDLKSRVIVITGGENRRLLNWKIIHH